MSDEKPLYRLRLMGVRDAEDVAKAILAKHGENYDAKLGDFQTEVLDANVVQVIVRDVALGDIETLVDDITEEHVVVAWQASKRDGSGWFSVEFDDA